MNDTQKIGYLLSGIRQEKSLQSVYVALQDKQVRGAITFEEACDDLHHRCEAMRADELLATPIYGQQKALLSTQGKRRNKKEGQDTSETIEQAPCLEKSCHETVKKFLPLCGLHYHQCVSGKTPEVELKDDLGTAKFNSKTQRIDYPSAVPKDRLPLPPSERPRKGLMMRPSQELNERVSLISRNEVKLVKEDDISVNVESGHSMHSPTSLKCLAKKRISETNTFYIDSGAG
jgi:hypothetical protein